MARASIGSRGTSHARAAASPGVVPLVLLLGFGGCFRSLDVPDAAMATASPPTPAAPKAAAAGEEWSPMPKSEEVDAILAQPAPSEGDAFGNVGKAIDQWKLEGAPAHAGIEAYAGENAPVYLRRDHARGAYWLFKQKAEQ